MKNVYLALFSLLFTLGVNAQVVSWDFEGNTGSEVLVNPTISDPNLTVSPVSRGVVIATALTNTYAGTNWTLTNSISNAVANNSYYQFTLKANSGFELSLSELNANFRRSATGPTSFQWMYSVDGNNFSDAGSVITYTGTENDGAAQSPLNLNVISALQNLQANVTITMRLYAFNAIDAAGSFALGRLSGDDLYISGKVFPSMVVPVKLVNFSAVNNSNITRLHWEVNCTSSSVQFDIERSTSNNNFVSIYNKSETQARCAQPFDVNDMNTPQGINFYRLKLTNLDGKVSYSNILQVVNKKALNSEIKVYPTITNSNATVSIPVDQNQTAEIIFLDNQGKQVEKMTVQLFKGTNNVAVNVSDLPAGKYYIKVISGDEKHNTPVLIKQ